MKHLPVLAVWWSLAIVTAQEPPVLQLTVEAAALPFDGSRPLPIVVELLHPSWGAPGRDDEVVLTPAQVAALAVQVTDAAGNEVSWPITRRSSPLAQPVVLPRVGRHVVVFECAPSATLTAGRHLLRARLPAQGGGGSDTLSRPVAVEVVLAPAPQMTLTCNAGPLVVLGWPAVVAARLAGPARGVCLLPKSPSAWRESLRLELVDDTNAAVEVGAELLPPPPRSHDRLVAGDVVDLLFRVPAAALPALAGERSWRVRFVPRSAAGGAVARGVVTSPLLPVRFAAAPSPLPPELQSQLAALAIDDLLVSAAVARGELLEPGLPASHREAAAQRFAAALVEAEQHALLVWRRDRSAPAAERLAAVFAAQGDEASAQAWLAHAEAGPAPSFAALLRVHGLGTPAPLPPAAAAALVVAKGVDHEAKPTAAPAIPAASAPAQAAPGPSPAPAVVPANPAPAPAASATSVVGNVSTGDCRTLDVAIAAAADGQWASAARASSEYSSTAYSAARATGAPDVSVHGNDANAWTPAAANKGREQLTLTFARAVAATAVKVRQSCQPGAIVKVELIGADGARQVVFAGRDPNVYAPLTIGWFVVTFPPTPFVVAAVELTLDTTVVPGWNEIDAVSLVGG